MKWRKEKQYMTNAYVLSEFPFFDVEVNGPDHGPWRIGYMFNIERKDFTDLEKAKAYVLKEIYKSYSKIDFSKVKTLDELSKVKYLAVTYETWCGNNGDGKYIHDHLWEKYHWIEGRFLNTSCTAKCYSIRYNIGTSEYYVKQHAIMILKRHIKRFLKQYENERIT